MLALAENWWLLALRGACGVLFGVAAFVWPEITLTALVLLFGAYALVDGVLAVVAAVRGVDRSQRRWALLLEGVVGILAAAVTVAWPGITALALLYLIAGWALVTGVLELIAAVRLRREIEGEWLLALSGAASILFGVLIVLNPGAGALAVLWIIGAYSILFGAVLIALGLRLRRLQHRSAVPAPAA